MLPASNGVPVIVLGVVLVLVGVALRFVPVDPSLTRTPLNRAIVAVGLFGWTVVLPLMGLAGIVMGALAVLRG